MSADLVSNAKAMLPGGIPVREAFPSEEEFFRRRLDVAGFAADDGAVVLNPYSPLTESQRNAVALNEAARIVMARRKDLRPEFALTVEQSIAFANYGPEDAVRATVAARLLSGDPSALAATAEQIAFVVRLASEMQIAVDHLASSQRAPLKHGPTRVESLRGTETVSQTVSDAESIAKAFPHADELELDHAAFSEQVAEALHPLKDGSE